MSSKMSTRKALQRKQQEKKQKQCDMAQELEKRVGVFLDDMGKAVQQAKQDSDTCVALTGALIKSAEQPEPTTEADFASLKEHLPQIIGAQQQTLDRIGPQSPLAQSLQVFTQMNRLIMRVIVDEDQRAQQRAGELEAARQAERQLKERVEQLDEKCRELQETLHQCRICYEEKAPLHVIVPCGHVACEHCVATLRGHCCYCRAKIKLTCKLHL